MESGHEAQIEELKAALVAEAAKLASKDRKAGDSLIIAENMRQLLEQMIKLMPD